MALADYYSRLFDQGGAEAAGLGAFVLVDPIGLHGDYPMRVSEIGELLTLLQGLP